MSFLKADRYQDGHPANSDPLDEQQWLVNTINKLESLPSWSSTAIIINWDDSDGWYDQVMSPIVNPSSDPANDVLNGNQCGTGTSPLGVEDRCGYGPRIPIMVISPYAKQNYVSNTLLDQTSILKLIEDNWNLGSVGPSSYDNLAGSLDGMFNFNQPPRTDKLFLNPQTGEPVSQGSTSTCTDQDTDPDVCAIQSSFSHITTPAGDYIWLNSEMDLTTHAPSTGLTVHYSGQWIYVQLQDGTTLNVPAPNAEVVYSPTATDRDDGLYRRTMGDHRPPELHWGRLPLGRGLPGPHRRIVAGSQGHMDR